jgi:hypothetical protein
MAPAIHDIAGLDVGRRGALPARVLRALIPCYASTGARSIDFLTERHAILLAPRILGSCGHAWHNKHQYRGDNGFHGALPADTKCYSITACGTIPDARRRAGRCVAAASSSPGGAPHVGRARGRSRRSSRPLRRFLPIGFADRSIASIRKKRLLALIGINSNLTRLFSRPAMPHSSTKGHRHAARSQIRRCFIGLPDPAARQADDAMMPVTGPCAAHRQASPWRRHDDFIKASCARLAVDKERAHILRVHGV